MVSHRRRMAAGRPSFGRRPWSGRRPSHPWACHHRLRASRLIGRRRWPECRPYAECDLSDPVRDRLGLESDRRDLAWSGRSLAEPDRAAAGSPGRRRAPAGGSSAQAEAPRAIRRPRRARAARRRSTAPARTAAPTRSLRPTGHGEGPGPARIPFSAGTTHGRVQISNNRGCVNGWTNHARVCGICTAVDGVPRPRTDGKTRRL